MKLAVQICAEREWEDTKAVRRVNGSRLRTQPFGEYFEDAVGGHEALVYESGATKTRAAAACQYAIDRWNPDCVLNLGTCGGVEEDIGIGDVVLATRTFQYDVFQRFGEPSERFLRGLETALDLSWVDLSAHTGKVRKGPIASADQDLDDALREILKRKGALAADWESASIAAVCAVNGTKCLILRGVSDIPVRSNGLGGSVQERDYLTNTPLIMGALFSAIERFAFRC